MNNYILDKNNVFLDLEIQLFRGVWVTARQLAKILDNIVLEAMGY
jgi:hypothetical protein